MFCLFHITKPVYFLMENRIAQMKLKFDYLLKGNLDSFAIFYDLRKRDAFS